MPAGGPVRGRRRSVPIPDHEVLAGGRRAVHHAAAGDYQASRNGGAELRDLPDAGVRLADDRDALADAQGGRAALPEESIGGTGEDGSSGGAGWGPGDDMGGVGPIASRHGRDGLRRIYPPGRGRAGESQDGGPDGPGQRRDCPGRLRRSRRGEGRRAPSGTIRGITRWRTRTRCSTSRRSPTGTTPSIRLLSWGGLRKRTTGWAR